MRDLTAESLLDQAKLYWLVEKKIRRMWKIEIARSKQMSEKTIIKKGDRFYIRAGTKHLNHLLQKQHETNYPGFKRYSAEIVE